MPIVKKTCRVCGKPYEACRSVKREVGVFHWQEVACSPECGTEYLRMVTEARNPAPKAKRYVKPVKSVVEETPTPAISEVEASKDEIVTE